jgi:hypothetical protein
MSTKDAIDPSTVEFQKTRLPKTIVRRFAETEQKSRARLFFICLLVHVRDGKFQLKQRIGRLDSGYYASEKSALDDVINWRMKFEGYKNVGGRWIEPPKENTKHGPTSLLPSSVMSPLIARSPMGAQGHGPMLETPTEQYAIDDELEADGPSAPKKQKGQTGFFFFFYHPIWPYTVDCRTASLSQSEPARASTTGAARQFEEDSRRGTCQ